MYLRNWFSTLQQGYNKLLNHFQIENSELLFTDTLVRHVYTCAGIAKFAKGDTEVFLEKQLRVESPEVCYEEMIVKVMFDNDELNDPSIINEQALEDSLLGSHANYRGKTQVPTS